MFLLTTFPGKNRFTMSSKSSPSAKLFPELPSTLSLTTTASMPSADIILPENPEDKIKSFFTSISSQLWWVDRYRIL